MVQASFFHFSFLSLHSETLLQKLTAENGTGSADNVGIAIDMRRTNADARLPAVDDVVDDVDAIAAFRRVVVELVPDAPMKPPPPPPPPMPIPPPQPPIDDDD
ncbi:hypothetical protein GCK72_008888 [Caenorhabditis remanei]|uniref:Uncharacterized protein n=1 Tax=Caenorhabditis remanei TaxID=31234 RepID=A0A6A5H0W1_CAERE|nr:hypothetical protein GCK72_008888 [Caenorhabditis remanei]KAF1760639.1 hypothetical protein GCK72_008888 [Caenorhabditis remanei]